MRKIENLEFDGEGDSEPIITKFGRVHIRRVNMNGGPTLYWPIDRNGNPFTGAMPEASLNAWIERVASKLLTHHLPDHTATVVICGLPAVEVCFSMNPDNVTCPDCASVQ